VSEEHYERVRAAVRAVPAGPIPQPWRALPFLHAGGLLEVGIHALPSGEELVLVVTTAGRGVLSATGEKLARDRTEPDDDWYDEYALTAEGIGPLAGVRVRLAGLHGGGLPLCTRDGWSVTRYPVDWPDEYLVLAPPGRDALFPGREDGCVLVFGPDDVMTLRAFGFSPSGRLLVVATPDGVRAYAR
jgi:hypothetical protein